MKSIVLISLLIGFSNIYGQEASFGFKVGTNISNLKLEVPQSTSGIYAPDNKLKLSYAIGGFAEFSFSEKFSLMPELLLSSKGARVNYASNDFAGGFGGRPVITIENTIRLIYLEIPIYAVHKIPTNTGKFLMKAGPYFGTALSAKIASNMGGRNDKEILRLEFGDTQNPQGTIVRRLDAGINFGIAYEFASGVSLNATYSVGLTNIGDPDPVDPWPNDDFRPRSRFNESRNRIIRLALAFKL